MAKLNGRVMTSLVVDPPNGRVPILPDVAKGPPPNFNLADNPEERMLNERCLVHPAGPPMVGGSPVPAYLQIVQTPDYVMLCAAVDCPCADGQIQGADVRDCLPRGELRVGVHSAWGAGDGEVGETAGVRKAIRNAAPRP